MWIKTFFFVITSIGVLCHEINLIFFAFFFLSFATAYILFLLLTIDSALLVFSSSFIQGFHFLVEFLLWPGP